MIPNAIMSVFHKIHSSNPKYLYLSIYSTHFLFPKIKPTAYELAFLKTWTGPSPGSIMNSLSLNEAHQTPDPKDQDSQLWDQLTVSIHQRCTDFY